MSLRLNLGILELFLLFSPWVRFCGIERFLKLVGLVMGWLVGVVKDGSVVLLGGLGVVMGWLVGVVKDGSVVLLGVLGVLGVLSFKDSFFLSLYYFFD